MLRPLGQDKLMGRQRTDLFRFAIRDPRSVHGRDLFRCLCACHHRFDSCRPFGRRNQLVTIVHWLFSSIVGRLGKITGMVMCHTT